MKKWIIALAMLAGAAPALAACVPVQIAGARLGEAFAQADAVFLGEVVRFGPLGFDTEAFLMERRVYKGSVGQMPRLSWSMMNRPCQPTPKQMGARALYFVKHDGAGRRFMAIIDLGGADEPQLLAQAEQLAPD